jgi:hypothetical protein
MAKRSNRVLHCAALTCTILIAYAYFVPPTSPEYFSTNASVRFYLTKSLAIDRSFAIEKYYLGGIDAAFYQGHYYSGKAPATSFLAVPVYWLAWETVGRHFAIPDWVYLYLVQVCVISLPSVLMALLLHGFLCRFVPSEWYADLLVIGYSLGTMAFPYSTQFVGHQLAAVLLFGCFIVLLKWRRVLAFAISPSRRFARSSLLVAGVLGGLAVAADYQVMLILCVIFIFTAFSFRRIGDTIIFALGCIPGVFLILLYNYACFGDMLSFPYAHEAMPIAREVQSQGLFGVRMPELIPFLMLMVSPFRGIFFVSLFLLLVIPGLYSLGRSRVDGDTMENAVGASKRRLFGLCLISVLGYILFNSSYGAWAGGSAYGPRFLVPVIPFFIVPIAFLMARQPKGYGVLLSVLVAYSISFHLVGTAGGALAHEHLWNPVREFLLPSFLRGNVRPNWLTLLGCPRGVSLVVLVTLIGGGIALFLATGKRMGTVGARSPLTSLDMCFLWLCILIACAMILLFIFYETSESAYRYAVIGHSYDYSGDKDAAIPYFEKSLQMDPVNPLVLNDLTAILVERGEYRKSLEIHLRALAVRPEEQEIKARAALLARIVDVSNAIDSSPQRKELLLERAALLERLGCSGAAQRDRERASQVSRGLTP